jgi:hypothetical protein
MNNYQILNLIIVKQIINNMREYNNQVFNNKIINKQLNGIVLQLIILIKTNINHKR